MAKILIVEDEIDVSRVLVKRLTSEGFDVRIVTDAYGATESIHKNDIDLVILDMLIPAGGGMSVLENIKMGITRRKHIPVVALTVMADKDYREKVMEMGADAYINKPYDANELLATIRDLLEKNKKQ